ncbi:unnamed protein product [Symbiodinium sp. KB8]|nr:unnamed protein product [Symbiodinium sp. KB8]
MMIFRSIIVFAIIADITCIIVRPSGTEESKDTSRRAKPKDETQRLQLENTRLRDKVKLLQTESTQVCTQRTGRKGGQVCNSFVEEEEEELEDAEEKSEEAKAVTSLADAELRKVLEESNEAAEEALAAAEGKHLLRMDSVLRASTPKAVFQRRPLILPPAPAEATRRDRESLVGSDSAISLHGLATLCMSGRTEAGGSAQQDRRRAAFRLHVPKSLRLLCAGAAAPVPRKAMSFYRAMSRCLLRGMAVERAVVPWYHEEQVLSPWQAFCRNSVYPVWFKYVKGPMERYQYEHTVAELRGYGLMQDDQHNDKEPVIERALELLPHDLIVGRYRRLMRAQVSFGYKMPLHVVLPYSEAIYLWPLVQWQRDRQKRGQEEARTASTSAT